MQLVHRLQDYGTIDDEQVELGFQAEQQTLDRLIVNGTQVESSALGHVHIYVVHTRDQVTKSCRQGRLQSHFRTQRCRVHEPEDDGDAFYGGEPDTPILVMESLLYDIPEHVGAVRKGDAVEEKWHAHLTDVRVLRVANVPQTGIQRQGQLVVLMVIDGMHSLLNNEILLTPNEESTMIPGCSIKGVSVQGEYIHAM